MRFSDLANLLFARTRPELTAYFVIDLLSTGISRVMEWKKRGKIPMHAMEKVFHFDAPREKYSCDAAIVWCFDNRFQLGFSKFLKRIGIVNSDPIKIAGGAKCLASPEHETDREFVLDQIRKSIRLHRTRLVILMLHSDCGAYGGLPGFGGDAQREAQHHEEELRRAAAFLESAIPGIDVQAYFVDFEGVWSVDLARQSARSAKSATVQTA
jgi:hypothetical protein